MPDASSTTSLAAITRCALPSTSVTRSRTRRGVERSCKRLACAFVGERSDELQSRALLLQPRDGRGEVWTQSRDFAVPTAGQQRDVDVVRVEAERGARLARIEVHRNLIGERMADELGVHAVLVVEALLERQQAQDRGRRRRRSSARAPAARPRPAGSRTARCGMPCAFSAARPAG